jgi:DNA-binding transcriptional ArsR family regulator
MLENIFVSKVRVGIISLFLRNPEVPYHVREITRQVGTEINAVRRELKNLSRLGFLKREPRGNRVYFEVKKEFPFYEEFVGMIFKETGFGRKLLDHLPLLGKVKWAFVSRPFAQGSKSSAGAIDLLLVGEVNLAALEKLIKEEEAKRGREVNYTVLGEEELKVRQKRHDTFLQKVLQQPRLTLVGSEERFLKR